MPPAPSRGTVAPAGVAAARRSAVLLLVGLLATYLDLPWKAVALVPLALAARETVRSLREMARAGAPRRAMVWSGVGLALIAYLTGSVLLMLAMYGPFTTYQDCLAGANTAVARAKCQDQLDGSFGDRLGGLDLRR
jgi:hypothetical protein